MATLRIQNGPLAGQSFEVLEELVIGRDEVGAKVEDAQVSRHHAVVRLLGGAVEVEDLGSTNGTFVDGERLEGKRAVGDGAQIRVGTTVLEVSLPPEATQLRPAADADVTRLGARTVDPDATRPRAARPERVAPEPVAPPQPARAAPGAPAPDRPEPTPAEPAFVAVPVVAAPAVGQFSPPSMRRASGLASRSWIPVVLSFGSVVLTAIALVIYFATR